jgi:hypothetical protein
VSGVAFKTSLDVMPFEVVDALKEWFGAEQEWRDTYKVVTGTELEGFVGLIKVPIDLRVVETVQNGFGPVAEDVLVVAEKDIIAIELDDLL